MEVKFAFLGIILSLFVAPFYFIVGALFFIFRGSGFWGKLFLWLSAIFSVYGAVATYFAPRIWVVDFGVHQYPDIGIYQLVWAAAAYGILQIFSNKGESQKQSEQEEDNP